MKYNDLKRLHKTSSIVIEYRGQRLEFPVESITEAFWTFLSQFGDIEMSNDKITTDEV